MQNNQSMGTCVWVDGHRCRRGSFRRRGGRDCGVGSTRCEGEESLWTVRPALAGL